MLNEINGARSRGYRARRFLLSFFWRGGLAMPRILVGARRITRAPRTRDKYVNWIVRTVTRARLARRRLCVVADGTVWPLRNGMPFLEYVGERVRSINAIERAFSISSVAPNWARERARVVPLQRRTPFDLDAERFLPSGILIVRLWMEGSACKLHARLTSKVNDPRARSWRRATNASAFAKRVRACSCAARFYNSAAFDHTRPSLLPSREMQDDFTKTRVRDENPLGTRVSRTRSARGSYAMRESNSTRPQSLRIDVQTTKKKL